MIPHFDKKVSPAQAIFGEWRITKTQPQCSTWLTSKAGDSNKWQGPAAFFAGSFHRVSGKLSTDFSTAMKVKPEQVDRLVDQIFKAYRSKELIVLKTPENDVRAKIKNIIRQNFHEEEAIEEEARQVLATHAGQVKQAGEMDHYKMFLLIKQKLAQKKGFVL